MRDGRGSPNSLPPKPNGVIAMTSTAHNQHADHGHVHGEGCGHVAVPHGDHVDYIHDGCRHAAHNQHYDEH